jgi:hypothetical protein
MDRARRPRLLREVQFKPELGVIKVLLPQGINAPQTDRRAPCAPTPHEGTTIGRALLLGQVSVGTRGSQELRDAAAMTGIASDESIRANAVSTRCSAGIGLWFAGARGCFAVGPFVCGRLSLRHALSKCISTRAHIVPAPGRACLARATSLLVAPASMSETGPAVLPEAVEASASAFSCSFAFSIEGIGTNFDPASISTETPQRRRMSDCPDVHFRRHSTARLRRCSSSSESHCRRLCRAVGIGISALRS